MNEVRHLIVLIMVTLKIEDCALESVINQKSNSGMKILPKVTDVEADLRLRDRWNAFIIESTKEYDFDLEASSPVNVTFVEGQTIFITCALNRPLRADSRHKVSFLRVKDFGLLFVGGQRHNRDQRFDVVPVSEPIRRRWTMQIRNVKQNDSGLYECQLNTEPKSKSLLFNVTIIPSSISIEPGERVIHIGVGHKLQLSCIVRTGPVIPSFIFWYRNDKILEYDDSIDAHVEINIVNSKSGPHRSDLTLNQVGVNDSGEYRCGSDLTSEAMVRVMVVPRETEQELKSHHHLESDLSSSGPSLESSILVIVAFSVINVNNY